MESKQRYTPETIMVFPLDMEKLNKTINKFFHEKGGKFPADVTYNARGILALMRHPKLCILNDEFVGQDIGDKITFYVYESWERERGHTWFSCLPSQEISMPIKELEVYLKESTSLAEFTKERRGYNSRIRANEAEWIKYLNK